MSERDEPKTVLVTEDDPSVRRLLVRSLEREGYRVLEAASPEEAVQTCREAGSGVDLLLTDVRMPEMEGPELAARLREIVPGLRVLFVSGYSESSGLLPDELGPAEDFLAKPFSPDRLKAVVRDILARE